MSVNIRQWDARRIDKMETEAVNTRNAAVARAARVHKSLLPGAPELADVQKITGEIRAFTYKSTLPWAEGVQILKTQGYFEFNEKLNELKAEWQRRVDTFIGAYPDLKSRARRDLGSLYNDEDYPDVGSLAERFSVETRFLPVPEASDWRVDLGDEVIAELQASVRDQLAQSQAVAMQEVWSRVEKVVRHAHERLSNPKAIFRDSLIENAVELCDLLPTLNIADDPNLDVIRQELQDSICGHDPKRLRKDVNTRQQAAQQLAKTMSKMSGMFGNGTV